MPLDIDKLITAMTREVISHERNGAPARSVVLTRTFDVSREELWEAITSPERLPQWFLPVSGDLSAGGTYKLEGNAGGTIQVCEPPARLEITWEWEDTVSWVTAALEDAPDGGTTLQLKHIEAVAAPDEFWAHFGPGAGGIGWDMALLGLDGHLANDESMSPEKSMAWMASDEGLAFIRLSGEAWHDASVAFGTDPADARAAADRTTASYTGEEAAAG